MFPGEKARLESVKSSKEKKAVSIIIVYAEQRSGYSIQACGSGLSPASLT